jgi:peptidoglycan/xylan/chitin deacetylase (PgdA/CDA1 family)
VPLVELSERARARRPLDGLVAVTFDDALAGVARHALPVLHDLGLPATLFTVSTMWGRTPPWWPGSGPTMTRTELVEAAAHGMTLAAHTRTHASLPRLPAAALREEVAGSRAELEDLAGVPVRQFAYPFGHHDPAVRDAVREAGYAAAYTFLNGRVTGVEDPLRLPRLTMGRHHTPTRLAYHLARGPGSWPDHQLDRVVGEDPLT